MKAFRLSGYSVLAACAPAGAVVEPVAMPTEKSAVELEPFVETSNTIVDIAAGNPDFSTLFAAVLAADLAEAFSGEGPFTVFGPHQWSLRPITGRHTGKLALTREQTTTDRHPALPRGCR